MRRLLILLWVIPSLLPFFSSPAVAQDDDPAEGPLAGHSLHGDAFNEGPRQKAYLMEGTGKVNFPITTDSPLIQKFFNQGVGQLHGFWYFESERSFRQVAALQTNCAMAYWGMAMANVNNLKRAREFIKTAAQLNRGLSPRESAWIDCWTAYYTEDKRDNKEHRKALVAGLEKITRDYPADLEAKAFLALQIWDNSSHGIALKDRQPVEDLIAAIMTAEPMHPAHHYRIHLWNSGGRDTNALVSAALCGQSSPAIAHMWHMPGHTFSGLKRYADAAWQQEASARADHAYMMRDHVLPDQIHNYAHNNEWLIRDLNFVGRVHDSLDLAKNMIELPRHPKYNTLTHGSANLGRARLLDTLSRYELWDETISLADTIYLEPTSLEMEQVKRLRALGVAYFSKGDLSRGGAQLATLEARLIKVGPKSVGKKDSACDDNEESAPTKPPLPKGQGGKTLQNAIEAAIAELKMLQALKSGDLKTARERMVVVKDLSKERQSQIQWQLGNVEKAEQLASEAVKASPKQVLPLANYIDLLYRDKKFKEVFSEFNNLRGLSAWIDLDAPVFRRLRPVADNLSYGKDWRLPQIYPADVGIRPPLNKIGPLRWQPSPAPQWSLSDSTGKTVSLKQFKGKPVVVIFYLGYGCPHCILQLNAFAPVAGEFKDAGISLVAVSTDSVEGLRKTLERAKRDTAFPFPLLSDASLKSFKAYRAFDDFENMPLHGTFLVDGNGLVRWQDISYEPFTETKFLLDEAKRLLGTRNLKAAEARFTDAR